MTRGHAYAPAEERFWAKVEKLANGCWIWTASTSGSNPDRLYGSFVVDGRRSGPRKRVKAHRYAYELLVAPIPDGWDLHHLIEEKICTSSLCVNPSHLVPITRREHVRATEGGFAAVNAKKTACPRGHPYAGENLYVYPSGGRACRACRSDLNTKGLV